MLKRFFMVGALLTRVGLLACAQAPSRPSAVPLIEFPDWTGTSKGNYMSVQGEKGEYKVPLCPLTGPFLFSFHGFDPRFIFERGFTGLGLITTEAGVVTQENPDWIQVGEQCRTDFQPNKCHFLTSSKQRTNLAYLYAYLKEEPLSDVDRRAVEDVITTFFGGDRTLKNFSFSRVVGYRERLLFGTPSFWFLFIKQ